MALNAANPRIFSNGLAGLNTTSRRHGEAFAAFPAPVTQSEIKLGGFLHENSGAPNHDTHGRRDDDLSQQYGD